MAHLHPHRRTAQINTDTYTGSEAHPAEKVMQFMAEWTVHSHLDLVVSFGPLHVAVLLPLAYAPLAPFAQTIPFSHFSWAGFIVAATEAGVG